MMDALRRIAVWTFTVGSVAFAIGFFGPMFWAPDANQGPLLGIFYTGPLGALAGFAVGVLGELLGWSVTPLDWLRSRGIGRRELLRGAAGIGGAIVLWEVLRGLPAGVGRATASGIVVGAALLWYAAAGCIPVWFRR